MAKQATDTRRKLVEFDAETWHALNLLSRESMKTFQELADEVFRDLLHKYERPTDLKRLCERARVPPLSRMCHGGGVPKSGTSAGCGAVYCC